MDAIELNDVACRVLVGVTQAQRRKAQDVFVSLRLETDMSACAASDDFRAAVDYWSVENAVRQAAESRPWQLVESLAQRAAETVLSQYPQVARVRVEATKRPRVLKNRRHVTAVLSRGRDGRPGEPDILWARDISCLVKIGVPEEERRKAQRLVFDLGLEADLAACAAKDDFRLAVDTEAVANVVIEAVQARRWQLLEAVAERAASVVLAQQKRVRAVTVRARKRPAVMPRTGAVVVELRRGRP